MRRVGSACQNVCKSHKALIVGTAHPTLALSKSHLSKSHLFIHTRRRVGSACQNVCKSHKALIVGTAHLPYFICMNKQITKDKGLLDKGQMTKDKHQTKELAQSFAQARV